MTTKKENSVVNTVENGIAIDSGKYALKFFAKDLQITLAEPAQMKPKPTSPEEIANLKFGQIFADHMIEIDWNAEVGWTKPRICPIHDFQFHPATKIFHYAPSVFEGMKAFRGVVDGQIRMFRPQMNMARMRRAAARASLPDFDPVELLTIIETLISIEADWVPSTPQCAASLYIRPALIATDATLELSSPKAAKLYVISGPVGAYFQTGLQPVTVLADPSVARSFPGGVGGYKMGCNYAPTIYVGKLAMEKYGCHQVLWLFGEDEKLTEVGVMNIFLFQRDQNGTLELITPPTTDCLVLDGVVRDSILTITQEWGEFRVVERYPTMAEIRKALQENRIIQLFGTGTACAVCPINKIVYKGTKKGNAENSLEMLEIPSSKELPKELNLISRLYEIITGIQYGRIGQLDGEKKEWIRILKKNT